MGRFILESPTLFDFARLLASLRAAPGAACGSTSRGSACYALNDSPQPHSEEAFGLFILKPDSWSVSTKSSTVPVR